jgi:hypothetical protein
MSILLGSDSSFATMSIMGIGWVASMYIAQTVKSHNILTSLPLKRDTIILADYTAYIIQIIFVALATYLTVYVADNYLGAEFKEKTNLIISILTFSAIIGAIIAKSLFEYLRQFGYWGNIASIISTIGLFLGLMTMSLKLAKNNVISNSYYLIPIGLGLFFIIFFVTKRYFRRLDF